MRNVNKKKLEIFCKMTKTAVDEGVIFEGNKIVEVPPMVEDKLEKNK